MFKFITLLLSISISSAQAVTIIGIAGGTASGKTTLARKLQEKFSQDVTVLSQDNYYKNLSHLSEKDREGLNFDIPSAIDFSLLGQHLRDLKLGKSIPNQKYNFVTLESIAQGTVSSNKVIIVEGILLFAVEEVRNLFDLKIFVEVDDDIRFARRLDYYPRAYGFRHEWLIKQYLTTVKQAHDEYIAPSKKHADIIVSSHKDTVAAEAVIGAFITCSINKNFSISLSNKE